MGRRDTSPYPRFVGLRMTEKEYAHLLELTREQDREISAVVRALIAQAAPTDALRVPRESGKGRHHRPRPRPRRTLVGVEE